MITWLCGVHNWKLLDVNTVYAAFGNVRYIRIILFNKPVFLVKYTMCNAFMHTVMLHTTWKLGTASYVLNDLFLNGMILTPNARKTVFYALKIVAKSSAVGDICPPKQRFELKWPQFMYRSSTVQSQCTCEVLSQSVNSLMSYW